MKRKELETLISLDSPGSVKNSYTVRIPGATAATLMIANVQATNEGTYSVIVSNAYSSATAQANLRLTDFECTGPNVVTEPTEAALRTPSSSADTFNSVSTAPSLSRKQSPSQKMSRCRNVLRNPNLHQPVRLGHD